MATSGQFTASQVLDFGWPEAPGSCKQMSGQALFWSLHHWSVLYQIMIIKRKPWRQNLTFGCVGDVADVDGGLADSKLGEACNGDGNECDEMHPDVDDIDVMSLLV